MYSILLFLYESVLPFTENFIHAISDGKINFRKQGRFLYFLITRIFLLLFPPMLRRNNAAILTSEYLYLVQFFSLNANILVKVVKNFSSRLQ